MYLKQQQASVALNLENVNVHHMPQQPQQHYQPYQAQPQQNTGRIRTTGNSYQNQPQSSAYQITSHHITKTKN